MPTIADAHVEAIHVLRQLRIEPEYITRDLDTSRDAPREFDRSGHGAEVHTLRRGALLDLTHIAL